MDEFWAITGIGWGRGKTPEEAVETYRRIQHRNHPSLTEAELDECWGWVWKAPVGADGFVLDSAVWWQVGDGTQRATEEQRIAPVGNVPDWARA